MYLMELTVVRHISDMRKAFYPLSKESLIQSRKTFSIEILSGYFAIQIQCVE